MQLALRPYVTTGVAIVGASVIAVAPIAPTPPDIRIPNPTVQVDRAVQLTANEIENLFNQAAFVGAQLVTTLAKLPSPVVAQLLGIPEPAAQLLLAGAALGLSGPLISGTGAGGAALQDVVDQLGSGDLAALINALIGAPATLIDGLVNGNYGPNLASLLGLPAQFITVLAGGLINPGGLDLLAGIITLPGTIPTLQALITQLTTVLGGGDILAAAAPLALPVESEGAIEAAVNALLFNLVATPIVTIAGLLGQVLAPVLGEEEAAMLPLAALGLLGPLISGPGAFGSAVQDVVDSLGSGDFAGVLTTLIGAPATIIDGFVNGGYGPDLAKLVTPLLPALPPAIPIGINPPGCTPGPGCTSVLAVPSYGSPIFAPGLITPESLVKQVIPGAPFQLILTPGLPGTFPTLQELVSQIFGLLPGAPAATTLAAAAPVSTLSISSVDTFDTSDKKLVTLDVAPDLGDDSHGKPTADLTAGLAPAAKVPPKVEEIKTAITGTEKGPDVGQNVSEVAKPDAAHTPPAGLSTDTDTDTLDTSDGAKFEPETTVPEAGDKKGGGANPVGGAISSVAKGLAGAVKGALGG